MAISEFTISGVLGVTSAAAIPRRPAAAVGLGFTFTFRLYMVVLDYHLTWNKNREISMVVRIHGWRIESNRIALVMYEGAAGIVCLMGNEQGELTIRV